jgi:membrane fusion protein (multidrug efflux system)
MSSAKRDNLIALIVITVVGVAIMITVGVGGRLTASSNRNQVQVQLAIPKTPVSVIDAQPEEIEIVSSYAGFFRPFERHKLSFEIAGRVEALGTNEQGKPLDQGDKVVAGQEIARLDQRVVAAQLRESRARLEEAQSDMRRATELRATGQRMISEEAFESMVTQLETSKVAVDLAEKGLKDTVLTAPATGVLSQRMINIGESVAANATVFELIENDRLLMQVGVPESRISEVRVNQPVRLELMRKDRYGEPSQTLTGEVYRVGEVADDKWGMFLVEVVVPNPDGALKPGVIAKAAIVTSKVLGFRLPHHSAVLRDGRRIIFSVSEDQHAHAVELTRWIEQGPDLVLPVDELPESHRQVVVRGQHRLIDGREVEIIEPDAVGQTEAGPTIESSVQVP